MKSQSNNLIALILDDNDSWNKLYSVILPLKGISVTTVTNSDQALRILDRLHLYKDTLDVFITDYMHPGLIGPDLIRKIRELPDKMTMQGGLRIRHLPIVVHTASVFHEEIGSIDASIPILMKPEKDYSFLRAIDTVVRDYRDKILAELHHVGIAVQFQGGKFALCHCYAIDKKIGFETKYIDATSQDGPTNATKAYRRLILIVDRHWSAQLAIQEFEFLLNHPGTSERDFQQFFRLHPEFLYQNCFVDHWAEPVLQSRRTGKEYKPDFILKSLFLPDRPWSWKIVELKRADVPLISNSSFHATLSQHVHKVASQLRNYSEYFDDPSNYNEIRTRFGTEIRKPKLVAIIGRLPKDGVLQEYSRLKNQLLDVAIVTYDEVLEFRRSQIEWRTSSGIL